MRTATVTSLALTAVALAAAAPAARADDGYDPGDYTTTTHCAMKVKRHYSMTALLRHGIRVPVSCDGPANVTLALQIDRPKLLDLRMPGNGIQDVWGQTQVKAAGGLALKIHMDKRSRRHLGRRDTTFSGLMGLCVGPYGKWSCTAEPRDNRRVTFTR
jgi:hypothetical protein